MTKINYQKAEFLLSVAKLPQLPPDQGIEIAIVGRSNAGKSSVLNCLTQQKKLARVSNTPGRTQLINIFTIDATRRLVDLPGYGYAKVSVTIQKAWRVLLDDYLSTRKSLRGLIVVMDIRHPFQPIDQDILAWSGASEIPTHVLLNKVDKLSKHATVQTQRLLEKEMLPLYSKLSMQVFSATKGTGLKELEKVLGAWYTGPDAFTSAND